MKLRKWLGWKMMGYPYNWLGWMTIYKVGARMHNPKEKRNA